jgi:predicted hydrocarbon binding protein
MAGSGSEYYTQFDQKPRRLGVVAYSPGRKLTEFLVTLDNVPGAMGKVSSMCGSLGVNILSGYHNSEADDPHMIWHFFADTTGKDSVEVAKVIESVAHVSQVTFSDGAVPELVTSKMSYPVMMLGNVRAVIFSLDSFANVIRSLQSTFGSGAGFALFRMGKGAGEFRARVLREKFHLIDPKLAISTAIDLATSFGWGNLVLQEFDYNKKRVAIVIHDLFECSALKGFDHEPMGHYMRGACTGLLSVLMDTPMTVTETDCIARGDSYCRFAASKA